MNDKIRDALIAMSSLVPVVGGTISFILDKYLPSEAEKKKEAFLLQLSEDIAQIKEEIDVRNLETPEFQAIFTRIMHAVIEEYRQEKIVAFRNITINLISNPNILNFNKADFYSRLVVMLIPDEIKMLYLFYLLDVKNELQELDDNPARRDIYSIAVKVWGCIDKEYFGALTTNCTRYYLIWSSKAQQKKSSRDGLFLSELGKGFVKYIFEPIEVRLNE